MAQNAKNRMARMPQKSQDYCYTILKTQLPSIIKDTHSYKNSSRPEKSMSKIINVHQIQTVKINKKSHQN
jgi:hypothetical protein